MRAPHMGSTCGGPNEPALSATGPWLSATKGAVILFGWVLFLVLLGAPHVRPMGRTYGGQNEIDLTPIGVELSG